MNTARFLTVAFPLLLHSLSALEVDALPGILASCNGKPVARDEVVAELKSPLSALKLPEDRDKIEKLIRRAVDNVICRRILDEQLAAAELRPSRALALEYINAAMAPLAPAAKLALERGLLPHVDDGAFQLKAATHLLLVRVFGRDRMEVASGEVERFYELNRSRYSKPDRWDVGVIRIGSEKKDAVEAAEAARARLLQGEPFERVAGEYDPEGSGKNVPAEKLHVFFTRELSRMAEGDVSPVLRAADGLYVLQLRRRKIGGVMSLDEAEPYIRIELSALKDTLALRRFLAERFRASKIVYAELPQSELRDEAVR